MPRSAITGIYARTVNSFSQPVFGTLIDPNDADALFDDQDVGMNPPQLAGPLKIINALQVGSTGTAAGTIEFFNATSGSITISPPTGALGSVIMTLPDATDTFVGKATTDTLTNKTLTNPAINGATILTSTYNKVTITSPATSATLTLIDGTTLTGPAASGTVMTLGNTETVTGAKTFTAASNTYNKVTITAPATSATLTLIDGTTLTGPAASGTAMTLGNTETVTGIKTFGSAGAVGRLKVAGTTSGSTVLDATAIASGTLTLPAATDTLVGKATTDTLTNKTLDSAGTGNVLKVSGVTVSAGQYPGTATNDSATAGNVGEILSSVILSAAAVTLTSTIAADVTSVVLTAGDWDFWGDVWMLPGGTTTSTLQIAWVNISSATNPAVPALSNSILQIWMNSPAGGGINMPTGVATVKVATTQTVYLSAAVTFAVSTMKVYGTLWARRRR